MADQPLVPATKLAGALAPVGRQPIDLGDGAMILAFDLDDRQQVATFRRSLVGDKKDARNCIGDVIDIAWWYAQTAYGVNEETGEVGPYLHTTMVCADGTLYHTSSANILRCLRLYDCLDRQSPWSPPWRVTIRQRSIKPPKVMMYLEEHDQQPSTTKRK